VIKEDIKILQPNKDLGTGREIKNKARTKAKTGEPPKGISVYAGEKNRGMEKRGIQSFLVVGVPELLLFHESRTRDGLRKVFVTTYCEGRTTRIEEKRRLRGSAWLTGKEGGVLLGGHLNKI